MQKVKRELGDDADRVRFIWITVDPERDSAASLKTRLDVFDPEFIALTGTRKSLESVWDMFRVQVEIDDSQSSAAGYLISHTANTYLVDSSGKVHLEFPFGTAPTNITQDIKNILKQTETRAKK